MLSTVEVVASIISAVFYIYLINITNSTWNKVKRNSYYLLPLLLSFYILFIHKFIVIVNAINTWHWETKVTLAHSLVFAILFQSIFFVDKRYENRSEKIKALSIVATVLLTGYVLGLNAIALAVALVEVYFIFISPDMLLSYGFAIYFVVDYFYVIDVLFGGFLIYAYLLEPVATLLVTLGFKNVFKAIFQKEEL